MKGEIFEIKNMDDELILPVTTVEAVYLEDGKTLDDEIKNINSSLDNLESEVNELKEGNINIDLTNYVTKNELSTKADKTELHSHTNKTVLDGITTSKISEWNNKSTFNGDYNNLTNKPTIPTKVSELTNDKGYLTEHQDVSWDAIIEKPTTFKPSSHNHSINDISDYPNNLVTKDYVDEAINNAKLEGGDAQVDLSIYAKKTDLHDHSNKTILDSITTSKVNQWDNKSNFSGNYNDLTNKPTIPTKVSDLTNDKGYLTSIPSEYVTDSELNNRGYLTEHQDISGKVDKVNGKSLISDSEIERLSTLKNYDDTDIKNTLNSKANKTDLHSHTNKTVLDGITSAKVNQWDNKSNFSGNYNDLTNKPTIPTKVSELTNDKGYLTTVPSEYITETELNSKGYLTQHQDISHKVDKINGYSLVSNAEISRLATLKNYDDTEVRELINETNTSLDNIKNGIIINGIDIANPPNNLLPCDMTGKTDSTEKLKNILKYATNNYSHVKIIIPNGTILITDTIDIDVEKISIECNALILCDMSQEKYALRFGKTGTYDGRYNKGRTSYKGLFLRCVNTNINLRSNAILFTGTMETVGSSNITFENCIIQDFNNGLTYADRSYFIRMNNSDLYGNVTQINIIGGVDTGENIKFTNCAIANGGTALECDNSLSTVYFNGCSIDYNYNRIFNIKKGIVFVDNCHIEHSSSHFQGYVPFEMHSNDGNKCSITNSFILFADGGNNNLEYIIKNNYVENAMSFFSVSNCFLQGWKTTSGYIGTGLINMYSNQCYQWNDQCYKLSDAMNKIRDGHFYDASLSSHKDFIKYKEPNNIEIFSKYSRTYEGDNWLGIKKLTNYQTSGSACFLVPRNMLCTLFGGEMRLCADRNANVDIRFGLCRYINGEIVHEDLLYNMGQIKFGTEPITFNLTGRHLNRNNPSLDYIFMEVILYNCEKDTEVYLKDFSIYEF